uniref:Uncharacterized protein n=1 Tax=Lepeophtheirus salmonis TaxID=72036 RepID=A0A0K2TTB2_LEPSM
MNLKPSYELILATNFYVYFSRMIKLVYGNFV